MALWLCRLESDGLAAVGRDDDRARELGIGAWVLPIQDAGLYTHQRTLDIRFADDEIALHREGRIRGTAFNITNKQYLEVVSTHQAQLDAADNDVPNFNYGL